MKPPRCPVCGLSIRNLPPAIQNKPLSQLFELVEFSDYRPLPDGKAGHPTGTEWFCIQHAKQAKTLKHLDLESALNRLLGNKK